MAVTDMSATSRTGEPQERKTGQSRMPNQTIQFPGDRISIWSLARVRGAEGWIFCSPIGEQSGKDKVEE
jgi:hypothetical protein